MCEWVLEIAVLEKVYCLKSCNSNKKFFLKTSKGVLKNESENYANSRCTFRQKVC